MSDDGGERFEIERIVEKRYRNNRLEYLIKWRGYPNSENTWEPSTNIEGDQETELLAEYEASQKQKQANERSGRNLKTSSIENNQEDHIKKRPFNNTNQVPSSNNINGFDRGYEPEKILGATDSAGELMLLVKWRHSDEADLVPARIANFKCPKLVIDFYEQHSFWTRLPKTNE